MRAAIFFAFAFLAVFANAQVVERFVIDDFTVAQGQKVTLTLSGSISTNNAAEAITKEDSVFVAGCTDLIGCARDLQVQVFAGGDGRVFGVDVFSSDKFDFDGEFAVATPKGGRSVNIIQYDGNDNTFALDTSGLQGADRDFTDGGLATGIRFSAVSDLATTYTIELFTPNGGTCRGVVAFPIVIGTDYTRDDINTDLDYSQFSGDCELTNIGAVQITIPSEDAVDAIIRQVRAIGLPDPSESNTPTASPSVSSVPSQSPSAAPSSTRTASPSITPTSSPSRSSTPSRTPSPSGPCIEFCVCPSFTCQIAFDLDDDVNNVVLNPITSQFFFDDSDDVLPPRVVYVDDDANPDDDRVVYIEVDDDDLGQQPTFTVPTFTIPTFTFPTFSSFTVGTVTFPGITTAPTFTAPTITGVTSLNPDDDDDDNSGSASDSMILTASVAMVLIALLI